MVRSGTSTAPMPFGGSGSFDSSSSSSSAGGFNFVSPQRPLMPSRSSTQKAARGYSQLSSTMSPWTDDKNSRPVWSGPRSYRYGTTETSSPGSMIRAATI